MLAAMVIVTRVQPGTSKGITDLLLPQPSTVSQSAVPLVQHGSAQVRTEVSNSKTPTQHSFRNVETNELKAQTQQRLNDNKRLRSRSLQSESSFQFRTCQLNTRKNQTDSEVQKISHKTQLSRQITSRTKNGHAPPITCHEGTLYLLC